MATRSLNKVMLIGNLTRDPELRYTPAGTPVCTFGVATNRGWTTDTGDRKEETEFHRIVAWAKLAELCAKLLFKGRRVYLEGRLQTRQWSGQDGVTRSTTEVVIDDMLLLDSRRDHSRGGQSNDYGYDQGYDSGQYQSASAQPTDDQPPADSNDDQTSPSDDQTNKSSDQPASDSSDQASDKDKKSKEDKGSKPKKSSSKKKFSEDKDTKTDQADSDSSDSQDTSDDDNDIPF